MTHPLDTNICSAHMRHPAGLAHHFFQYAERIPGLRLEDWLTP